MKAANRISGLPKYIGGKPIAGRPEDADVPGLDALFIGNLT